MSRWLNTDDFDPDQIVADLEDQQRRMDSARAVIAETSITVRSPDRLVTITMNGASAVTDVRLHPDALRDLDADALGATILRTVQSAMAEAGEIVREQFGTVFDEALVDDAMRSWPGATTPTDEGNEAERPDSHVGRHYAV